MADPVRITGCLSVTDDEENEKFILHGLFAKSQHALNYSEAMVIYGVLERFLKRPAKKRKEAIRQELAALRDRETRLEDELRSLTDWRRDG